MGRTFTEEQLKRRREQQKIQRDRSPERFRRYREKNREAKNAAQRLRQANDPEYASRKRKSCIDSFLRHADRRNERRKAWRLSHPVEEAWASYRHNSRMAGRSFELAFDKFRELLLAPCDYCGKVSSPIGGIDRVDNNIAYVDSNCVPCCKTHNYMKRHISRDQFIADCTAVVEWQQKKKETKQ